MQNASVRSSVVIDVSRGCGRDRGNTLQNGRRALSHREPLVDYSVPRGAELEYRKEYSLMNEFEVETCKVAAPDSALVLISS